MQNLPTIPHGITAQRITWPELPAVVRSLVEARLGGTVTSAVSQNSGFTPGFASRVTTATGVRAFVKAASTANGEPFANSYREEARKLSALSARDIPAPRLLWVHDGEWVVLGFEDVAGRNPVRPWCREEVDRVLEALTPMTRALTPAPAGLTVSTFAAEFAAEPARWDRLDPDPSLRPHVDEGRALADAALRRCTGDTAAHLDLRDDNVILDDDGRVWICDWNWPVLAAPWVDLVSLLISVHGDGHDADAMLARHPLSRDVDPEDVDALLALLYAFWAVEAQLESPPHSPYLRLFQRWYAEVTLDWLTQRRRWNA